MVVHTSNPSYLEGRDWEDCGLRQKVHKTPFSINKLVMVVETIHPSYLGGINRRVVV
jgi:hypothetical protein